VDEHDPGESAGDKAPGDIAIGATLNKHGVLRLEAERVGRETALAQIIRLVEQAQGSKAPIHSCRSGVLVFVPVVVSVALLTLRPGCGDRQFTPSFVRDRRPGDRMSCAVGLAANRHHGGMGKGPKMASCSNSEALERARTTAIVLDKTGTLTRVSPSLISLSRSVALDQTNCFAGGRRRRGSSIRSAAVFVPQGSRSTLSQPQRFEALVGQGVATVDDHQCCRIWR
jgi:Cu+-exporting ATPase